MKIVNTRFSRLPLSFRMCPPLIMPNLFLVRLRPKKKVIFGKDPTSNFGIFRRVTSAFRGTRSYVPKVVFEQKRWGGVCLKLKVVCAPSFPFCIAVNNPDEMVSFMECRSSVMDRATFSYFFYAMCWTLGHYFEKALSFYKRFQMDGFLRMFIINL